MPKSSAFLTTSISISELPNPPVPMFRSLLSAHPHRGQWGSPPPIFSNNENNQTSSFSRGSKLSRHHRVEPTSPCRIGQSEAGRASLPLRVPRVPPESRCRVTVPSKTQCDPDSRRDKWLINLGSARALNEFLSPLLPSRPPAPSSHFFRPLLPLFLHSFLPPFAVILLAPLIRTYVRTYARVLLFPPLSFFLFSLFMVRARNTRRQRKCASRSGRSR